MKTFILFLLVAFSSLAQIPGTTPVGAPVAPPGTNSNFGATDTRWAKGGYGTWATSFSQLTDLNWLPAARRQEGMHEYVADTGTVYELGADLTTWTAIASGPTTGIATNVAQLTNNPSFGNLASVEVLGRSLPGDGGGGTFFIDTTDTTSATDGGMVFVNAAGKRFKRMWDANTINTLWFGAKPSNVVDSTPQIQAAINFAEKPTYGPISTALRTSVAVFVPPGTYFITQLRMTNTVRFFGEPPNINHIDSGTTLMQTNLFIGDAMEIYGNTTLENFRIFGMSEVNVTNLVPIVSSSSRTNFTVAVSGLPAYDPVSVSYPYFGHCFFYNAIGNYLGSGWVETINTNTGSVKLRQDTDFYATGMGNNYRLVPGDKVIFTPLSTVPKTGYFSARAPAGNNGIALKGTFGITHVEFVRVQNFLVGILREAGAGLQGSNLEIIGCKLASAGLLYPTASNDGLMDIGIFQGFYSRNGLPGGNAAGPTNLDNNLFRRCVYGFMWPGGSDLYSGLELSTHIIGVLQATAIDVFYQPLYVDSDLIGGLLIEGPTSPGTQADIDQFQVRSSFVTSGGEYPQVTVTDAHTYAIKVNPLFSQFSGVSIGTFHGRLFATNYVGAPTVPIAPFTNLFDIALNSDVQIGNIAQGSSGLAINFKEPGTKSPYVVNRNAAMTNAVDAQNNWFYPDIGMHYAMNGVELFNINTNGVNVYGGDAPGNIDLPMLRLQRLTGFVGTFEFWVHLDEFKIRNGAGGGHDALTIKDTLGINTMWLGSKDPIASPKTAKVHAEDALGTDVGGGSFAVSSGAGAGIGAPSTIVFQQPITNVSGTTPQTFENRMRIDSNGSLTLSQASGGAFDAPVDTSFQVISPLRGTKPFPRQTTTQRLAIPLAGNNGLFVFDTSFNTLFQLQGTGTNSWRAMAPQSLADVGDADVTVNPWQANFTVPYLTTLTASRVVTLGTVGAITGDTITVVRKGLGPFVLNVGGLKIIPANTAATVTVQFFNGAWNLIGYDIAGDVVPLDNSSGQNLAWLGSTIPVAVPKTGKVHGENALGTDVSGATVAITTGAGTGAAPLPTIAFQQPIPNVSGTTAQVYENRMLIDSVGSVNISQLAGGAFDNSSDTAFNVSSILRGSKPFPRMTSTQRMAISIVGNAGLYVYDITFNALFQIRGATTNSWRTMSPLTLADSGDADVTVNPWQAGFTVPYQTALTANRTVTLGTTGALSGDTITIVRSGLGAFTLSIGGLKTIPASTAASAVVQFYNGAWNLIGYSLL